MTDADDINSGDAPNEPIDATFEPAPAATPAAVKSGGPGWIGAGLLSLFAAVLGGAIGLFGNQLPPLAPGSASATADLAPQIERLSQAQSDMETAIAKAARDTKELETKLTRQLGDAGNADDAQALTTMLRELDAVSKRLDEALASSAGGEAFAELARRVEALERVDTDGPSSAQDISRAVAGLSERMDLVEEKLSALESASTTAGTDDALAAEIEALQGRLAALDAKTADAFNKIDRLSAQEAEQQAVLQETETREAFAMALAAASRGESFEAAYKTLRAAMPESATVRQLSGAAETPPPTLQDLRVSFQELEKRVIANGSASNEKSALGWLNKTFGDAVSVTPANPDSASTKAILNRASDALSNEDLATTLATLGQLDKDAQTVFADWTDTAQSRLALDRALTDLRRVIFEGDISAP